MTEPASRTPIYRGPAFLSYGFRPFFLSAALFAGLAIPTWVLLLSGEGSSSFFYPAREWHVHEMLFGFLPAVMTGFLLTAMPNWTDRPPVRGMPLLLMWLVWLAGRLVIAIPWPAPLVIVVVDGAFLILLATIVWRQIVAAKAWDRSPIGALIALYAAANISFHVMSLRGAETDLPERMAFAFIMTLLTLIGGRVTPAFTGEYMALQGIAEEPPSFSRVDGLSIALAGIAAVAWIVQPQATATGWIMTTAGTANMLRLSRWRGWVTWHEPLVLILHVGYGWVALSMLALGTAILGLGLRPVDAVHALTTGAVGSMTLAIMTRATLGHTGRARHADTVTVIIYLLANLGALLRVFGTTTGLSTNLLLGLAATAWSSAYLLFAVMYGRFILRPSLDE
ncbi:MAG: NnrS family protein [Nitrospiraceae bacterium]